MRKAWYWNMPIVIGIADALTAFGNMCHSFLLFALSIVGVHINTQIATLDDYLDKWSEITINGAGTTREFRFAKGGYQGGVRTPP